MPEPGDPANEWSRRVIGAAIEVHRQLGPGFIEEIYHNALTIEFGIQGIPFEKEKPVTINYKGYNIGDRRLDFLVAGMLVVELKAVADLAEIHRAQVISYLKATNQSLGLLINFNVTTLKDGLRRIVYTPKPISPLQELD